VDQTALIARISDMLGGLERAGSAFLGGSFGRGEADNVSDVDVYVVVANADDIPNMLTELSNNLEKVRPILLSNVLPNARTINSITNEWLRFDFTVLTQHEIGYFAQNQLKPLFDRLNAYGKMRPVAEYHRSLSADGLLEIVNEFIRVLGLSVVVHRRDDVVTAQTGTQLLRDMLIRIMAFENGGQPQRGALSLKRSLTVTQFAALTDLPPLEATWPSVFARSKVLAREFFPRARALATELGAKWPDEFERVTLARLRDELGLDIESGR
jgi:predicted nucleotidyltransferase